MIGLNLSAADRARLGEALASHHTRTIQVLTMTNDGDVVSDLNDEAVDGQVNLDSQADVTRMLQLNLHDPKRRIAFDTDATGGGVLDLSRMIRVRMKVTSPLLTKPLNVPVFTGPVSMLRRTGPMVYLEAQGPEVFGLGEAWRVQVFPKKTPKTDVIKAMLRRMGRSRVAIPDLDARLPREVTVGRKAQPWKVARRVAASMGRDLYFDAAGIARLRPKRQQPVWTFEATGDYPTITSPVTIEADKQRVKNAVVVVGSAKGRKKPVGHTEVAPRSHPLSPWRLGTETAPLYLVHRVHNPKIRTEAEAERVAKDALERLLRLHTETRFTAVPNPLLEPGDPVRVVTEHDATTIALRLFSLPLSPTGDMSIGTWRNVGMRKRRGHG